MNENNNSVFKYGENIIWSLPCLFQYEVIFGTFQSSLESYKFPLLNANIYGAPRTVWSAGRISAIRDELDKNQLKKLFNYVQSYNGIPSFTFSRLGITKELLQDRYANYILDFAIEHGARFIVSSDRLKDYIKDKNSNIEVVSSVIKPIYYFQSKENIEQLMLEEESEFYNKLLKEYDIVVVRPEYAKEILVNNPTLIDDISRIEILTNQVCISNCPMAPEHNVLLQESNNKQNLVPLSSNTFYCPKYQYSCSKNYQLNCAISENTIRKLVGAGLRHIKLQGRGETTLYGNLLFLLSSQIFNFDGPNYIFLEYLINNLSNEQRKFKKLVDPENKWSYWL